MVFEALRYAGVAYLLYLAYATWRDRSALAEEANGAPLSDRNLVTKAVLINLLNPKLTIFFLAFLPQFVRPSGDSELAQMLGLSATFMPVTFVIFQDRKLLGQQNGSITSHYSAAELGQWAGEATTYL